MKKPLARKYPRELIAHGDVRIDNYYWLNERENPEVIAYLEEENHYQEEMMKDTEPLQRQIYDEIVGRIKQDDVSYPVKRNGYYYYSRYEEGKEYPVYCRRKIIWIILNRSFSMVTRCRKVIIISISELIP